MEPSDICFFFEGGGALGAERKNRPETFFSWETPRQYNFEKKIFGGRFGYFLFFFCSGRGKWESEAPGRGGFGFFIENPRRGGGVQEEGLRGREGVCGELGNFEGWGAKYFFFRGRNVHQEFVLVPKFSKHLLSAFYNTPPL